MNEVFAEGDKVTYWYPDSEDHGEKGVVEKLITRKGEATRYRVIWSVDEPSVEPAQNLRHDPVLSSETAAQIAIYLALDAVEDEQVASWIKELQAHADNS